jgi:hypothetical protein
LREIEITKVHNSIECVVSSVSDDSQLSLDLLWCTSNWAYGKDKHRQGPQHDTVLVRYNRSNSNEVELGSTMDGRRVACLWCLFVVDVFNGLELALVQWFDCSRVADKDSGMFTVTKKTEYEVIEMETIE